MIQISSLSKASAKLCLRVAQNMRELDVHRGSRLLLAVSGGPDSSALVCICAILMEKLGYSLSAVTINHCLRAEAEEETAGSKALCERLGIPCSILRCDVPAYCRSHAVSVETAARTLRYACLEKERLRCGANYIVTAHHAGDLAEDVLMRLVRGCGWPALGGMRARDTLRHLLRPLLILEASELKSFLAELAVPWFTDASNADLRFTRNRFRHTILPLFTKENPRFLTKTQNLAWQAGYDKDFFDASLADLLNSAHWSLRLDAKEATLTVTRADLLSQHIAIRLRFYRAVLTSLVAIRHTVGMATNQASWTHFMALESVVSRGEGKKTVQFPGVIVRLERGKLIFTACLHV